MGCPWWLRVVVACASLTDAAWWSKSAREKPRAVAAPLAAAPTPAPARRPLAACVVEDLPSSMLRPDVEVMSIQGDLAFTGTFAVADFEPSPAPSAPPSPKPTMSDPSAAPTAAPSAAGLRLHVTTATHTPVWFVGESEQIDLHLTGLGDPDALSTGFVDVYMYDADDSTMQPVVVLAEGAEMIDGALSLSYAVTSDYVGGFKIRAHEYTYGYYAESDEFHISTTSYPTAAPSPDPTPAPTPTPTPGPLPEPTAAPTISTLLVDLQLDGDAAAPGATVVSNASVFTVTFTYSGELQKVSGYLTLRICESTSSHVAYSGDAAAATYESCDEAETLLLSQTFSESLTYEFTAPTIDSSKPFYLRADSIASRDSGDYDSQSAYTLAYESDNFYFVAFYPTAKPTEMPTIPPTYPPTTTPVFEPTAAPTTAPPSAAPVPAPTVGVLLDSALWYKTDEPSKDCVWVAAYFDTDNDDYVRCDVKGWDDTFAYESCALTCADYDSSNL